ncbi:MAG: 3-deoxy-7-phosphoheptulonate synthase [Candidatus Tokpelaia sp. JSC161]|nr:MAG: 3-deoxy-7-phosphoheptulonate synthase [Candidatus Tokpelaia sp. JSC161]
MIDREEGLSLIGRGDFYETNIKFAIFSCSISVSESGKVRIFLEKGRSSMIENWTPRSWRSKPGTQIPTYPDLQKLIEVEEHLYRYPPLIFADEALKLRKELADVAERKAFLLQGGDCAESFYEHDTGMIYDFFRVFLQMSVILTFGAAKPVVRVGRIAGQFAKPRSKNMEMRDGVELPAYRGDIINGLEFNVESRIPDPERMEVGYRQSAATLNLLRAFALGGYANIENIHKWMLAFVESLPLEKRYETLKCRIAETMDFIHVLGVTSKINSGFQETAFFTSHEALLLGYEEAMTRIDSATGHWYATSAHMLWIGDRTRQLDHAHVEYCRGIQNPIGLKCGPSLSSDDLLRLIDVLNPENEGGRLTLIARFGYKSIEESLPKLVRAVEREGRKVIWSCDPMHGNTITENGYKTRSFDSIIREIKSFFMVHHSEGSYPGGIHIEMTGKNVTECTGGLHDLSVKDLALRYHTHCDPRLNASQALELALLVAGFLKDSRDSGSLRMVVNN